MEIKNRGWVIENSCDGILWETASVTKEVTIAKIVVSTDKTWKQLQKIRGYKCVRCCTLWPHSEGD